MFEGAINSASLNEIPINGAVDPDPVDGGSVTAAVVATATTAETATASDAAQSLTALDLAGGNDGTLVNGPTWVDASVTTGIQGALSFDGTDDYVNIGDHPEHKGMEELSLEVLLYIESGQESFATPFMKNDFSANNPDRVYGVLFDGGGENSHFSFIFSTTASSNYKVDTATSAWNVGWYHLAFSYDGSTARVFVDGQEENSISATGDIVSFSNVDLRLAIQDAGQNQLFKGKLSEFRVWNVARTQTEIQDNKDRRLTGDEPGLVGYWPLDDRNTRLAAAPLATQETASAVTTTTFPAAVAAVQDGIDHAAAASNEPATAAAASIRFGTDFAAAVSASRILDGGINDNALNALPINGQVIERLTITVEGLPTQANSRAVTIAPGSIIGSQVASRTANENASAVDTAPSVAASAVSAISEETASSLDTALRSTAVALPLGSSSHATSFSGSSNPAAVISIQDGEDFSAAVSATPATTAAASPFAAQEYAAAASRATLLQAAALPHTSSTFAEAFSQALKLSSAAGALTSDEIARAYAGSSITPVRGRPIPLPGGIPGAFVVGTALSGVVDSGKGLNGAFRTARRLSGNYTQ